MDRDDDPRVHDRAREQADDLMEFELKRTSTAPIEAVFDALTDHRAIASYTWSVRRSTLDREGVPAPNGAGARRRLVSFGTTFVEEVVEYERPTHWAYSVRSGAPVRDHLGTIDLRAVDSGTEVTWHVRAQPMVPGSGPLITPPSKVLVDGLLKGALRLAERRVDRASPEVQPLLGDPTTMARPRLEPGTPLSSAEDPDRR